MRTRVFFYLLALHEGRGIVASEFWQRHACFSVFACKCKLCLCACSDKDEHTFPHVKQRTGMIMTPNPTHGASQLILLRRCVLFCRHTEWQGLVHVRATHVRARSSAKITFGVLGT
jgi:hypothetical protein